MLTVCDIKNAVHLQSSKSLICPQFQLTARTPA